MRRRRALRRAADLTLVAALVCASLASRAIIRLRTVDRNGDGRPDLWQYYDAAGRLLAVEADTNFDGRLDSYEQFVDGRPVRFERDRNFDGRVDLIEDFDPTSGEPIRSTIDLNFDGRSDVLTLFADGRPVFSERAADLSLPARATSTRRVGGVAGSGLLALEDPFSSTDWLGRSTFRGPPFVACVSSTSLPSASTVLLSKDEAVQIVWLGYASLVRSHRLVARAPRAPPASFLIS